MKKKLLTISFFMFFALPIPVAIFAWFWTSIRFFICMMTDKTLVETVSMFIGALIGGTYIISYLIALFLTCKNKKITKISLLPLFHCAVAVIYVISLTPTAIYISETTEHFGFAKKDFTVVEEIDTHGGFHGDGSYYLILDCSDNKDKALEKVKNWNKLPLSENLNNIMYGNSLTEEAHLPTIENGYYMFKDRQTDSTDDSELFDEASYNFSIAIYDSDTDKMYYFDFDT
ncbi:MAG: hypothetical protein J6V58_00095 [Clostridia bacterium]|nr:hypothetical protein [Clostridia bacterium]